MSDQNLDYTAIRQRVEKSVNQQKQFYRFIFFTMHLMLFVIAMLGVWGTVANNPQLRDVLYNSMPGTSLIVILPTILWSILLLSHVAALYFESSRGEKALREKLLIREVGEEMLRRGIAEDDLTEKPKRQAAVWEAEHLLSSDDGELLLTYEDENLPESEYNVRGHQADAR